MTDLTTYDALIVVRIVFIIRFHIGELLTYTYIHMLLLVVGVDISFLIYSFIEFQHYRGSVLVDINNIYILFAFAILYYIKHYLILVFWYVLLDISKFRPVLLQLTS